MMSDFSFGLDDDYISVNSSDTSENVEKRTDKITFFVKIIIAVLLLVLFFEIFVYNFIIPSKKAPRVNISGNSFYSAQEVADFLLPMNCTSFYSFDVDSALSILCSIPGVKNASIKKVFPNKIYIKLEERKPVSVTYANIDGKTKPLQIDEEGFLFPEKVKIDEAKVPIISGIPVEYLGEGMRIPEKYRTLINQIKILSESRNNYFQFLSEICVQPKDYGNFELVLIPVDSKIKVLADRTLNEEVFKYMMISLDVAETLKENVSVIDLRYGQTSFR